MRIAAMLRVRNEARWIAEVLESIKPLTTDIVVFDDHSTDATPDIAAVHGCIVINSPFPDETNETRDKNYLLDFVRRELNPDYVLSIDGDELLQAGTAEQIRARLNPAWCVYGFPIRYLWNDRGHYRADGVYGRFTRSSMFSLIDQTGDVKFRSTSYNCNFHCGNVPANLRGSGATMPANILHLGYMEAEDRIRKYHWYREKEPNAPGEDGYRHIVIGDLFPADSKFLHGGPLKVFPISTARA